MCEASRAQVRCCVPGAWAADVRRAILGGIGRPYGAIAGGMIIGLAEELSAYPWIGTEPLLPLGYKTGVAFAIMS